MIEWGTVLAGGAALGILYAGMKLWKKINNGDFDEVEFELEEYGELCQRLIKEIKNVREDIEATEKMLLLEEHALDQAILQWKAEYLKKQEKRLMELMTGGAEE